MQNLKIKLGKRQRAVLEQIKKGLITKNQLESYFFNQDRELFYFNEVQYRKNFYKVLASLEVNNILYWNGSSYILMEENILISKRNRNIINNKEKRRIFFDELFEKKLFTNIDSNSIKIETEFKENEKLIQYLNQNQSLEKIRNICLNKYNQIRQGLINSLAIDLNILKRKVYNWSNAFFDVILNSKNKLSLINNQRKEIVIIKRDKASKDLIEIIRMLVTDLNSIKNKVCLVSVTDYHLNLFSF